MDVPTLMPLSASFLLQIIEHVAHPIFVKDRSFRFAHVNSALCRMLGLRAEDMLGKTDYDFFPREQADFFRLKDTEMFQRDATVVIEEEPITDARGELHVLSTVKAPLHDERGEITHLVGIIHDITPLKRVEEDLRRTNLELAEAQAQLRAYAEGLERLLQERTAELRRRHDQLQAVLANLAEGVIGLDGAGAVVLQNDAARALTGAADGPMEAWAAAARLRYPDGRPVPAEELPMRRALQGEAVHNAQLRVGRPDGTDAWVLLSASPLPGGGGALCALRDVTALRDAERLKEEFLQVASHELRTPLASLKLLLGVVRAQLREQEGPMLPALLGRGHQMVDRMTRLISDILDVSRLQTRRLSLQTRPLELGAVVAEAVERARAVYDRHRFALRREGEVWVQGDLDRLDQVVSNLLTNACKYAPEGTTVTVRCGASGASATVAVSDEGPGIPSELHERVFDRFYQVEAGEGRSFGGLGLGLYISRELVLAHGGEIWVESKAGSGSTFQFSLPVIDAPG